MGPLIGAAFARLRLREPDGTLRAVAWVGTGPDFVGGRHTLPRGAGIAGRAVEEGKPVWVADFAADSRTVLTEGLRQYSAKSDSRSVLAVPLRLRGEIIGALTVGDRTGRVFTPADIALVEAFADQAALALDNARLYEETRERLRALQETQAQLVQAAKLSAVGQLVSGVAHELNNPLSVVIGHGQLMLTKNPPPEFRRPIELIVAQGDRMSKIVQGLLLFSRQRSTARGAVSLPEIVEQTLFLRAAQLRLSGIEAQVEHAPDLPAADGDAHQLQQVILNLVLNAEQAILAGARRARRRGGARRSGRPDPRSAWGSRERWRARSGCGLEVEDNGPGIAPDVLPRVFDPFFTTKAVGQGTGLGLSVSYGIVEQHGGHLLAESRPGRTVFTVLLPRYVEGRRRRRARRGGRRARGGRGPCGPRGGRRARHSSTSWWACSRAPAGRWTWRTAGAAALERVRGTRATISSCRTSACPTATARSSTARRWPTQPALARPIPLHDRRHRQSPRLGVPARHARGGAREAVQAHRAARRRRAPDDRSARQRRGA